MYKAIYVSRRKRSKTQTYASVPSVKKGGGGEGHNLMRGNVMFSAVTVLGMTNVSQQK